MAGLCRDGTEESFWESSKESVKYKISLADSDEISFYSQSEDGKALFRVMSGQSLTWLLAELSSSLWGLESYMSATLNKIQSSGKKKK